MSITTEHVIDREAPSEDRAASLAGAKEAIASGQAVPQGVRSIGVLILTILAVIYALYAGREVILPIVMAVVLKMLLGPAMRILHQKLRLPDPVSAVLLILVVFAAIAGLGFGVSMPAAGWLQRAPESLPLLQEKLAVFKQPIAYLQQGLREIASMSEVGSSTSSGSSSSAKSPSAVQDSAQKGSGDQPSGQAAPAAPGAPAPPPPVAGMAGSIASGAATVLSRLFTTLVVLFFLLASGDRLMRGFVEVLPRFKDKKQALRIADEIETNVTGYLLTITLMNALVGVATGLVMWWLGLGTPVLWGGAAFILNYIPILGPMVGVAMFFVVGLLSFDWPWGALAPAGAYLLIHIVEGETCTPMLLARRFTLNPVLVIVSLFFWDALWGVPGAFLAVPILAMIKVVADRIEPLKPMGHIIGS